MRSEISMRPTSSFLRFNFEVFFCVLISEFYLCVSISEIFLRFDFEVFFFVFGFDFVFVFDFDVRNFGNCAVSDSGSAMKQDPVSLKRCNISFKSTHCLIALLFKRKANIYRIHDICKPSNIKCHNISDKIDK